MLYEILFKQSELLLVHYDCLKLYMRRTPYHLATVPDSQFETL